MTLRAGLIVVAADLSGPLSRRTIALALDTGASMTAIDGTILRSLGYDPDASTDRCSVMTGNGLITAPRVVLNRLSSLGQHAIGPRVVSLALPADAEVDGLLGLDFFRGLALTIDFRLGRIQLV